MNITLVSVYPGRNCWVIGYADHTVYESSSCFISLPTLCYWLIMGSHCGFILTDIFLIANDAYLLLKSSLASRIFCFVKNLLVIFNDLLV